ncbi:MAG: hypothetical protein KatS3mg002_1722 [Candidatus Woesearchaeota archaeon]|nr:MAG: hypothetical protein KatS3mg002_1702 [Candidatus Woesearchaeota archaeon]GIW23671.1 MAG: hypothetical protein KatS3mg068_2678 [Candidatus Sericytochromatia bacterium]GIX40559.1 MAG: hypothetical protein KatS3mg129_0292 [Leptospiraceae bacterium]GIU70486.1 MAG: hypothetical protein KatS3mg002_1722 [Candidatus Woesearchaeota archaeon]GIX42030.1 MAG: hypothetical protein KatS3mg129_1763 [Leptospiraceae bacterium]
MISKNFIRQSYQQILPYQSKIIDTFTEICYAIILAKSLNVSEIARHLPQNRIRGKDKGKLRSFNSIYKWLNRKLEDLATKCDWNILFSLLHNEVEFLIGDPTEIERLYSYKTDYVGKLKVGERGYTLLSISAPFEGRALPIYFLLYSSSLIEQEKTSRNLKHKEAFEKIIQILREIPIVLDREFAYESLIHFFRLYLCKFIIRLTDKKVKLYYDNKKKQEVSLSIQPSELKVIKNVYYKGKEKVNLIGFWDPKYHKPLWLITNMDDPEKCIEIYQKRMRIEEMFRDIKSYFSIEDNMTRKLSKLETLLFLFCLTYHIIAITGYVTKHQFITNNNFKKKYSEIFLILFFDFRHLNINKETIIQIYQKTLEYIYIHLYPKFYTSTQCPIFSP